MATSGASFPEGAGAGASQLAEEAAVLEKRTAEFVGKLRKQLTIEMFSNPSGFAVKNQLPKNLEGIVETVRIIKGVENPEAGKVAELATLIEVNQVIANKVEHGEELIGRAKEAKKVRDRALAEWAAAEVLKEEVVVAGSSMDMTFGKAVDKGMETFKDWFGLE